MKLLKSVNPEIFREYDIRGIQDQDLSEDFAYTLGKSFGTYLKQTGHTKTIVGHDNRSTSPLYKEAMILGITETGIDVIDLGLVTTPMYYFGWTEYSIDSGIMITASHNPKQYNGFKFSFNGIHNACGSDVKKLYEIIEQGIYENGNGTVEKKDIKDSYLTYLTKDIHIGPRKLKIVVDCGNGTPAIIVDDVYKLINMPYSPLFCTSDPNFPNHTPDPSVDEFMVDLQKKVLLEHADLGIAYDGDGDRVGFVDEQGNVIHSDMFMIIIARDILPNLKDKRIMYDIKCTLALHDEIEKLGGTPIENRTGNSYLKKRTVEENIPFGGEYSGHVCFRDRFLGNDDGIYASLRMIEILTHTNKTMSQLLSGINQYYSTPEILIDKGETGKLEVIKKMKNYCDTLGYNYLDIDGIKAIFNDGTALIRASNTSPNVSIRFEAKSNERLEQLKEEFMKLVNE